MIGSTTRILQILSLRIEQRETFSKIKIHHLHSLSSRFTQNTYPSDILNRCFKTTYP